MDFIKESLNAFLDGGVDLVHHVHVHQVSADTVLAVYEPASATIEAPWRPNVTALNDFLSFDSDTPWTVALLG